MLKRAGAGVQPVALAITLAIGTVGGLVAQALHLPLGLLLGALLSVAAFAALDLRPFGKGIHVPPPLRWAFVPVIGVAIGGAFTPAVLAQVPGWWPSLLAVCLYVPTAQGVGYLIYRRGGLSPSTAWFGAVPGGLVDSVVLGEQAGADPQVLVTVHFLRIILVIVTLPLIFGWLAGHAVGSASGVQMTGSSLPLHAWDAGVLIVAGVAGAVGGRWLRMPASIMTGPLALSALAHLGGLTQTVPPGWAMAVTQIVVGTALGARFAGLQRGTLILAMRLAAMNVAAVLALALLVAEVLHVIVGEPVMAVVLAFAPGGLAEMSLVALSLQISVVFVTAHHVLRIVLSVTLARLLWPRVRRRAGG